MTRRSPCVSDYRSGDEFNPGSPDYAEPSRRPGSEPAEFAWVVSFEPAHPVHGDCVEAVVGGSYAYVDVAEGLSASERRLSRRDADEHGMEGSFERESQRFTPAWIDLPGERRLSMAEFAALPGAEPAPGKSQFDDASGELAEAARDAVDHPAKNKMLIGRVRADWPAATATPRSPKP